MSEKKKHADLIDENDIIKLFRQFHPKPSKRFYRKIHDAPWNSNRQSLRLSLQTSVLIGVLTVLFILSPFDSFTFVSNTFTPTATPVTSSTSTPDAWNSTPTPISYHISTPIP